MKKLNQPESGVLSSKPSNFTNLGGAALLALTGLYSGEVKAWTDGGNVDSAYGTSINTETVYGFAGSPDGTSLKTISDGSSGYDTLLSTDGFATSDEVNSVLEAYDPSIVGDRIAVLNYRQSNDEVMFWNVDGGYYFTVTGLSSGAVSAWTELEGSPSFVGSIDESTGRYFGTDYVGSTFAVAEYFPIADGLSPSTVYDDTSKNDSSFQADLANDRGFFRNGSSGSTNEIFELNNISTGSPSETSIGLYGYPVTYTTYDGQDALIVINSGTVEVYYDETSAVTDPDADGDGYAVTAGPDCDDTDADINPGADEECDGVDNNCDGSTDGADSIDATTWYVDNDGDGVGGAASTVACEATGVYVEETTGDWDDNDASVQTEPTEEPGVCEEGESAEGEFEEGETICGPDGSQGTVMSGTADYTVSLATLDADQDWVEFIGSLELGETFEDRYVFNPSENSIGGFGLGISADAMLSGSHMAPPPSEGGDSTFLTLRVDQGTVTVEDKLEGTSALVEAGDVYEVALESTEGDTGTDTGTDTGGDDTGPGDTDDTAVIDDTDTDSGNPDAPDDTGSDGDGETPKDGGQGGCNSCASTPMPNPSLVVLGLALAGTMMRRRRQ